MTWPLIAAYGAVALALIAAGCAFGYVVAACVVKGLAEGEDR